MLIKCNECHSEISDKSKNCIKCGSPISKKESSLDIFYGIFAIAVFTFAAYGVYKFFFSYEGSEISSSNVEDSEIASSKVNDSLINSSGVLITDQSLVKALFGYTYTLSFYAKHTGPKKKYNYYIQVGDHWYNRLISDKLCKGDFVLEEDEEKLIEVTCEAGIAINRYSLIVN